MTWSSIAYVKLLLQREADTQDKYLIALRTTADYYGWTEHFPVWTPKVVRTEGGRHFCQHPGTRGRLECQAGRRYRISRSPKKGGWPAGMTNAFKLSENCGLRDIAEVAQFTKVDWHWMEGPFGERIDRSRWLEMYAASH